MRCSAIALTVSTLFLSLASASPLPNPVAEPMKPAFHLPMRTPADPYAIHRRSLLAAASSSRKRAGQLQSRDITITDISGSGSESGSSSGSSSIKDSGSDSFGVDSSYSADRPAFNDEMEVDVDDYIAEDVTAIGHPCYDACKVQVMEGARTEREALCSAEGLRATHACARCIDSLWPDSSWEESALAEYERIVLTC